MPAPMSAIIIGTVKGLMREGPRSLRMVSASSICSRPPMALPTMTPTWSRFASVIWSPEPSRASRVANIANWTNRDMRRASLRSSRVSGLKSTTSLATWLGIPDGSNAWTRRTPDRPALTASHVSRVVCPREVMAPVPVTTTREPFSIFTLAFPHRGSLLLSRSPFHTGARFCDPSIAPPKTRRRPAWAAATGQQERRHPLLQPPGMDRVVQRGQRRGRQQRSVARLIKQDAARGHAGEPAPRLRDFGRGLLADHHVDLRDRQLCFLQAFRGRLGQASQQRSILGIAIAVGLGRAARGRRQHPSVVVRRG